MVSDFIRQERANLLATLDELPENTLIRQAVGDDPFLDFKTIDYLSADPSYFRTLLRNITNVGGHYPFTMRALSKIEPTKNLNEYAHVQYQNPQSWKLGLNTGKALESAAYSKSQNFGTNWSPGGLVTESGLVIPAYQEPLAQTASHEFAHALTKRYRDWAERAPASVQRDWDDFLTRVIEKNFNPNTAFSRYSESGQKRNLDWLVDQVTSGETAQNLQDMKLQAELGMEPLKIQYEKLPTWIKVHLAQEPMAEAFSAVHTPFSMEHLEPITDETFASGASGYTLKRGLEPTWSTVRSSDAGEELTAMIRGSRAHGFLGGATTPTMLRGAAMFGLPLAGEVVGPAMPNKFLRDVTTGAARGAGVGSMFGMPGMAIGAGLGALASQVL